MTRLMRTHLLCLCGTGMLCPFPPVTFVTLLLVVVPPFLSTNSDFFPPFAPSLFLHSHTHTLSHFSLSFWARTNTCCTTIIVPWHHLQIHWLYQKWISGIFKALSALSDALPCSLIMQPWRESPCMHHHASRDINSGIWKSSFWHKHKELHRNLNSDA